MMKGLREGEIVLDISNEKSCKEDVDGEMLH